MKKETAEYLMGQRNAVKDEFIISRETTGTAEHIVVSHPDVQDPIYNLWSGANKSRCYKLKTQDNEDEPKIKRRTTGGKKPYIMLMQGQETIPALSLLASGLLLKIFNGGHIEWHTGRVIYGRGKVSMTQGAMAKCFGAGKAKIKAIVSELVKKKAMRYDRKTRAYFVDRAIARKGGGVREDQV
jgi:hypothetical protein